MKKRIISFLVILCLVLCLFLGNVTQAYADPLTASQIGIASFAAMNSWGINFIAGNAASGNLGNFMEIQVNDYVSSLGSDLLTVFGEQLTIDVAGKLAMGQRMYNGIIGFCNWLSNKYNLGEENSNITSGYVKNTWLDEVSGLGPVRPSGYSATFQSYEESSTSYPYAGYRSVSYFYDGELINTRSASAVYRYLGDWYLQVENTTLWLYFPRVQKQTGEISPSRISQGTVSPAAITDSLSWNGENYVQPTVIDPSYEWLGTVGDYQDTNLEQLLGHILEDVEGNNLIVEGEVVPVDPPQPTPTPIPIDPDLPLQDVPWEGLDTNLQNLYNQGLEEIGAIGDAQDAITDAVADQTGALEGALTNNAGVISGAIGQAVSDVQDAISEQTQTLSESAAATAEATETIAEALEDETINWQKFDLRGLFPFCIPFDIYNMLEALDASPTAPHVELPFVIESIGFSYTIDLDFSDFDTVAAVMRQMELIVYGIALAWATSKVIKW